jgi:GNAT superfamily N-acetyltransferase
MYAMVYDFRLATECDAAYIWEILEKAIQRRKESGSEQWQDGYPNPEVITHDIARKKGYILTENDCLVGYVSVAINEEPEYVRLRGKWLTNEGFVVFHRLAVAESHLGKGCANQIFKWIEEFAKNRAIKSIKADTNFDNIPMLRLFDKHGYVYCGEVSFRGSPRRAYEKLLHF